LRYENYLMLARVSQLPYLEEDDQKQFMEALSRGSGNEGDTIEDDDYSGIERLKKVM